MNTFLVLLALSAQPGPIAKPHESTRIEGKVVDDKGNPAATAEVFLVPLMSSVRLDPDQTKTIADPNGLFHFDLVHETDVTLSRQPIAIWAIRADSTLAGFEFTRKTAPQKPITLKLGPKNTETILIHDPLGKPVAGARVIPFSVQIPGASLSQPLPDRIRDRLKVTTDIDGKAVITTVSRESLSVLIVESDRFGSQLGNNPPRDKPFVLAPVGRVRGRLTADDPKAVQGRLVRVFGRSMREQGIQVKRSQADVQTDSEGKFEVPAVVAGVVEIAVPNVPNNLYLTKTPWTQNVLAEGKTLDLLIPLEGPPKSRPHAVVGKMLDSKGAPVAGATVFTRGDTFETLTVETDREGTYRLEGVPIGRAFVFVRKPGYRFTGSIANNDSDILNFTLVRSDEKPAESMKSLETPLDAKERNALARKILDPYLEKAIKGGLQPGLMKSMEATARVDPEHALELVDQKLFKEEMLNEMIRAIAAIAILEEEGIDDALNIAESIGDPYAKMTTYFMLIDRIPGGDRKKKLEVVSRALLIAKNLKDPVFRLIGMSQAADRLFDLGETEHATKLLRDALADAEKLPNAAFPGFARSMFAEELSVIDLPAALNMIKDLTDKFEFDRHHGNIAHEIAARSPADAERVLALVKDPNQRDQYAVRVCYRTAPRDLDRARKIASTIGDESLRAYALGIMAENLAATNRTLAISLLNQSYDLLDHCVNNSARNDRSLTQPEDVAATLVGSAEKIDPALVSECFWKTLALRSLGKTPADRTRSKNIDAKIAAPLARYHKVIARLLIEPIDPASLDDWNPLIATAAIDPRRAVELIERIPEPAANDYQEFKNRARVEIAQALARKGEVFWKYIRSHVSYLWIPDVEDLNPFE
jgi:hypothetical protein